MRFGKSVWLAKRKITPNATKPTYDTPIEIVVRPNHFSVMQVVNKGYMEVVSYGEDLDTTWTAIANSYAFDGFFKEGDLMWLDGEKPNSEIESEYGNGASANAVIKLVAEINTTINITLTKNKAQVKQ